MTALALILSTSLLAAPAAPGQRSAKASASQRRPAPTAQRPSWPTVPYSPVLHRHLKGKTVLVLGDSMIVTGLQIWMTHALKRHGASFRRVAWASSTTERWATTRRLDWALAKHRPQVVLIVLGSNELFLPRPRERARHVRTIVKKLGHRPFRWLAPPVWGQQTGIVDVIGANVPKGRFYAFKNLTIQRHRDGRHPSVWGARTWVYDFFRWWDRRLRAEQRSQKSR